MSFTEPQGQPDSQGSPRNIQTFEEKKENPKKNNTESEYNDLEFVEQLKFKTNEDAQVEEKIQKKEHTELEDAQVEEKIQKKEHTEVEDAQVDIIDDARSLKSFDSQKSTKSEFKKIFKKIKDIKKSNKLQNTVIL
jgi:hypothetical protein